jgi:hypothetical protein
MRGSPAAGYEPSLEDRLAQLDVQLRQFEASLRAHQQSHGRARSLELELAALVERGAAVIRDLASIGDRIRDAADRATHDALAASRDSVHDFERRGTQLLDAYATAVRAAQQAVARAEARIDAFDERVAHELTQAGREIREAVTLLRERPADTGRPDHQPPSYARRLMPALVATVLLLGGIAGYTWLTRTLRYASTRAEATERHAQEARRETKQQIASLERAAQQTTGEALSRAARAERMVSVLVSPDAIRMVMQGHRAAPGAAGQVMWSPSRGVVITGTRLPPLEAEEIYQAWLVTPRAVVSLGVLTPDEQGRITAAFDLPANLAGTVRGFMITREPAGGSARPSRTVVLAT